MTAEAVIHFAPFRLEVGHERLWRAEQLLPLRPKPFAILRYLVEHAGQRVTKEELLKAVWPGAYVSEGLLNTYIRDLRRVLGDEAEAPRWIETVARRGYRFIGTITPPDRDAQAPLVVGREAEFARLQAWLEQALSGKRQVVFVTGEPGIGKTTLVETFLSQVKAEHLLWIGRGQCIEHYGGGEAYLPVLEALERLGREAQGERVVAVLRQYAPTWLVQLPGLLPEEELEGLQRKVQGAAKERMLRELTGALEVLTAERPLVLALEDLHWSDYSTLDWLSYMARRHEPARLLVVGTYRPVEVIVSGHPVKAVKQELHMHAQCEELSVGLLTEAAVTEYLARRFSHTQFPVEFGRAIYQGTEGNPLFLVNVVDDLVGQGLLVQREKGWELQAGVTEVALGVPESLRQLIARQLERLSPEERRLLEVGSVAGMEFAVATVAAGMEEEAERIEGWCEGLAQRGHFLQAWGLSEWPDGTVTGRYGFLHAVYQNVLYEQVAAARRIRLHRRIGEREEAGYGERASEKAAELAVHFEQGHDYQRAVRYHYQAGERALMRSALQEAIIHFNKALEWFKILPEAPDHAQQELSIQMFRGVSLMTTKGYAAPEVAEVQARIQALCREVGDTPQMFQALPQLRGFHFVRGELQTARALAEQYREIAQRFPAPVVLVWASYGLGETLLFSGEISPARAYLEQGIAAYDPKQVRGVLGVRSVQDPGVACLSQTGRALWYLGYPDQSRERFQRALALAQDLAHPFSVAWALSNMSSLYQFHRDARLTQEWAEATLKFAREQGFPFWIARGEIFHGWALAQQGQGVEGLAQLHQGLAAYRAMGVELYRVQSLGLLAEAYGQIGQEAEGLQVLAEALEAIHTTGARLYEAEVYWLRGELTLKCEVAKRPATGKSRTRPSKSPVQSRAVEAEGYFQQAVEVARRQQAKSLELRAAMSLARLWQQQGRQVEARQLLAEIYGWFMEGFDTKDLQEAKALLKELS